MMLSLLIVFSAAAAVPADAAPTSECEQFVSKVLGAADAETRVVITFTGSQRALLPLDEAHTAGVEHTLFPVGRDNFVLTLQVRPARPNQSAADAFAKGICSLGVSNGARFNGVMSFARESVTSDGRVTPERMTDAMMAEPQK